MISQVEASTISAGALLSENKFVVPDYQRRYSWSPSTQIDEFWSDLSRAVGSGDYFLGLIILANDPNRQEIVDGQQRLVTLTLLANALRIAAVEQGRKLVAESLRTTFLYAMSFETEVQTPRIKLTNDDDSRDFRTLLRTDTITGIRDLPASSINDAQRALLDHLLADLGEQDNAALRVGQWSEFVTKQVHFAVFRHPDRSAAFRVFEVVNTRGKVLTPAELIKSYVIGTVGDARDKTYEEWESIEQQIEAAGGIEQLTNFVRHVVSLDHGYVIPRELYAIITKQYPGAGGAERLLGALGQKLPVYAQMLDPGIDEEATEVQNRAFSIADVLSLGRFRPILLAASSETNAEHIYAEIMDILIPGSLANAFGSGSIEAQFARAARRAHKREASWPDTLRRLRELRPPRDEFVLRLTRNVNKQQAHVVLAAYQQSSNLPRLDGFPHLVRPRGGENWPSFSDDDFSEMGSYVGNWVLTRTDRRPPGAKTPEGFVQKLAPRLLPSERSVDANAWTSNKSLEETSDIVKAVAELWYGN